MLLQIFIHFKMNNENYSTFKIKIEKKNCKVLKSQKLFVWNIMMYVWILPQFSIILFFALEEILCETGLVNSILFGWIN